ncbi:hypothetical protein C8F04DRAFT_187371 [Mycena alexandri]|uniref:Uncharacterized protein n=1 Tax=Mycena alexandri TaxID=1745969 RepID=A0AAD6XA75_9AGAR|nr:hypothetical protein C8F04DRAFT_187371 [Mycena alexandri]
MFSPRNPPRPISVLAAMCIAHSSSSMASNFPERVTRASLPNLRRGNISHRKHALGEPSQKPQMQENASWGRKTTYTLSDRNRQATATDHRRGQRSGNVSIEQARNRATHQRGHPVICVDCAILTTRRCSDAVTVQLLLGTAVYFLRESDPTYFLTRKNARARSSKRQNASWGRKVDRDRHSIVDRLSTKHCDAQAASNQAVVVPPTEPQEEQKQGVAMARPTSEIMSARVRVTAAGDFGRF